MDRDSDAIEWYRVIISFLASVILSLLYIKFPLSIYSNIIWDLVYNCIPSSIVVLIAVPILYIISYRKGVTFEQKTDHSLFYILEEIRSIKNEAIGNKLKKIIKLAYRTEKDIEIIKSSQSIDDIVKLISKLESLETSVNRLKFDTNDIAREISVEIKSQHDNYLNIIQLKYEKHIYESREVVLRSIKNELDKIVELKNNEKSILQNKFISLIENAIHTMGVFASEMNRKESGDLFNKVERGIVESFNKVIDEVDELKYKIDSLPLLNEPK